MKITNAKENPAERSSSGAFTLVEMMIVLAVVVILAGIVITRSPHGSHSQEAPISAVRTQISILGTALGAYKVDNGVFPVDRAGLQALTQKPHDASNWKGPYIEKEIPSDPWGKPYTYEFPGRHNPTGYDLYTTGPDGTVYGNWTEKQR